MILFVNIENIISSKCDAVFEAIVDPLHMSHYFISSGSSRLEAGREVIWSWADVGMELPIQVLKAEKYKVEFVWSASGAETTVQITLQSDGERTIVKVHETGWDSSEEGILRYGQQIQGWTEMLACLKAYLEFGINLRAGITVTSDMLE